LCSLGSLVRFHWLDRLDVESKSISTSDGARMALTHHPDRLDAHYRVKTPFFSVVLRLRLFWGDTVVQRRTQRFADKTFDHSMECGKSGTPAGKTRGRRKAVVATQSWPGLFHRLVRVEQVDTQRKYRVRGPESILILVSSPKKIFHKQ
jgi:hypothetical protein